MYIRRSLSSALHEALSYFPAILITGPRQSGKTTLLKEEIKKAQYVTFDDPLMQEFAISDPKGFLQQYGGTKTILDEIIVRARNVGNDFTSETGEEIYNTFVIKRKEEYRELKEQRKNKHRKK